MIIKTEIGKIDSDYDYKVLLKNKIINKGAFFLKKGEVIAFPTETVYGLGANALNKNAVKKIFLAKGRPADNPLIVHVDKNKKLSNIIRGNLSDFVVSLIDNFWPGPLTIIFPVNRKIPEIVTAGLDTVAVRMPVHPVARALITVCGYPLAAPSANVSGYPSPTIAEHVYRDLKGKIPYIIDGGACPVGLESTVLDPGISKNKPVILRPGAITAEDIFKLTGQRVKNADEDNGRDGTPLSPGMKYRHYAPSTPVKILQIDEPFRLAGFLNKLDKKSAVLLSEETIQTVKSINFEKQKIVNMGSCDDLEGIAHRLFALLRKLDQQDFDYIYIEKVRDQGIGRAIMNRLHKASQENIYL